IALLIASIWNFVARRGARAAAAEAEPASTREPIWVRHSVKPDDTASAPKSLVLHSLAGYYDPLAPFFALGRERERRDRLAALVDLAPGESVLDVGCGTGSLVLAAKRRVGRTGMATGIDASPEMIERARRKATNKGDGIHFEVARVES